MVHINLYCYLSNPSLKSLLLIIAGGYGIGAPGSLPDPYAQPVYGQPAYGQPAYGGYTGYGAAPGYY